MVFVIAAAVIVLAALSLSYYVYYLAFKPRKDRGKTSEPLALPGCARFADRSRELIKASIALGYETVSVKSFDGLTLRGRYREIKKGAPLHLQFHGYRSYAPRDFSGNTVLAEKLGFNTLSVDQRAHGDSEGRAICFGVKERYDVVTWARYAAGRFDCPIFISGISMGGATVLMASDLELPDKVVGIIADCPYSSPKLIIKKVARDMGLPADLCWPFAWLGALIFGGFVMKDSVTALSSIKNSRLPVLLIHGDADSFVPSKMSLDLKAAGGEKVRLELFAGADHGVSFLSDEKRYEKLLLDFCGELLDSV
ncbi:MAG: alpha/beta hydrolase [Clostridia bacterium]|nr:alpha/beta hydrolase [Clostridia bacterium]